MFLPIHEGASSTVDITIGADNVLEPVVESVNFVLSNLQNAALSDPSTAPLFIIDDDGTPARVGLEGDAYSQSETFSPVRVPVFRAGDVTAGSSVYAIAPGRHEPGDPRCRLQRDTAGRGHVRARRSRRDDRLLDRQRQRAGILGDAHDHVVRSVGGDAGHNGDDVHDPGQRGTVEAAESLSPPPPQVEVQMGALPDPRDAHLHRGHGWIRGGEDELALRRNMKNGNCSWWNGKRFKRGPCGGRLWLELPRYEKDFFYYRINPLRPSIGTRIKNYSAFSRATDGAGNVEDKFEAKRNANTFEVKPKGRR
jgi:hypothetical protein